MPVALWQRRRRCRPYGPPASRPSPEGEPSHVFPVRAHARSLFSTSIQRFSSGWSLDCGCGPQPGRVLGQKLVWPAYWPSRQSWRERRLRATCWCGCGAHAAADRSAVAPRRSKLLGHLVPSCFDSCDRRRQQWHSSIALVGQVIIDQECLETWGLEGSGDIYGVN